MKNIDAIKKRVKEIEESLHCIDMEIECGEADATTFEYQDELSIRLSELQWVLDVDTES